jgi:hypothetical protein
LFWRRAVQTRALGVHEEYAADEDAPVNPFVIDAKMALSNTLT